MMEPDLLSAINEVWHSSSAQCAVKRAAARHLAGVPNYCDTTSHVASHVARTVGNVSSLGISQSFRQLIGSDPCFVLEGAALDEAYVTLDVPQLLSQQSWQQAERPVKQQQHQHQPHLAAEPATSSKQVQQRSTPQVARIIPQITAAISALWPAQSSSCEARVKRAAALNLINRPNHTSTSSGLAKEVKESLGANLKSLGCAASFSQILKQAPDIFVFKAGPSEHEALVALSGRGLLQLLERYQRLQQLQQPPPPPALRTPAVPQQADSAAAGSSATSEGPAAASPFSFAAVVASPRQLQRAVSTDSTQNTPAPTWLAGLAPAASPKSFAAVAASAAGHGGQAPHVAAPTAAGSSGSVSGRELLQFVSGRVWHADNPQLHTARRALAAHLVQEANPVLDGRAAASELSAYIITSPLAGQVMLKALQARFGAGVQRCYSKMSAAVAHDPYLSVFMSGHSEQSVKLDISKLLQDVAQHRSQGHLMTPFYKPPHAMAPAGSTASSSSTGRPAGMQQHLVTAGSTGTAGMTAALTGAMAAASPSGSAAAAVLSGLDAAFSSSSAAEAAAAALEAAAWSLMPPAAAGSTPAATEDNTPLLQASTAAAAEAVQASAAAVTTATSDAGPTAAAGPGHVGQAAVSSSSVHSSPPPGFPVWLALNRLQQPAAMQEEQQQEPSALPPASSTGAPWQSAPAGAQQQAEAVLDMQQQSVPGGDNSTHPDSSAAAVLKFELLMHRSKPGWYTAEYVAVTLGQQSTSAAGTATTGVTGAAGSNTEPHPQATSSSSSSSSSSNSDGGDSSSMDVVAGDVVATSSAAAATGPHSSSAGSTTEPPELSAILQLLPDKLHSVLHPHLPQPDASAQPQLTHILIDREQPVTLRLSNRTSITLPTPLVTLEEALQHLMAAAQHWEQQLAVQPENNNRNSSSNGVGGGQEAISPVNGDVSGQKQASSSSIKPAAEQPDSAALQAAAQTLFSSSSSSSSSSSGCVGVPGSVHHVAAVFDGAGQVTGLTYRLQHHVQGAALGLADVLTAMKASLMADSGRDRPHSLLVVGRPGAGKSRLLCDVCRLMSEGPEQGGLGLHVLLLDTTGQVAGLSSHPSPHIGPTRRLWVCDPTQQGQVVRQAVLQHAPDVLVVDELSSPQDVAAAVAISRSHNMLLVAGVPVINLQGLVQDDTFSPLAGCERRSGQGQYNTLWNNNSSSQVEQVRPPIAGGVLELESSDKWRLHTDLQASINSLLAQGAASVIGNPSSCQQPQLNTQLRSRAADGRLLVDLSSAEAVGSALADAGLLRDEIGNATCGE